MSKAKKFGGVSTRVENKKAKTYSHLQGKPKGVITREKASTRTSDDTLTSGSINYNLSVGTNLISYPFQNPSTAFSGNGEPNIPQWEDTTGYWTPEELDAEFDNNIYGIIGQGAAATKLDQSPGTSGSFVGSLMKIWPRHSYWINVTGSSTLNKTISKQLIESDYVTKLSPGWNFRSYPFSEYTNVSPAGFVPAGNNRNIVGSNIRLGVLNQLSGEGTAGVYIGSTATGEWQGSFTFQTGSGFLIFNPNNFDRYTKLFERYASTGSDSGEANNDPDEENFFTGSSDVCYGSGSNYIDTPIDMGYFLMGSGGGTFQVYSSIDSYRVLLRSTFTGSAGLESSSILNHDNTQMITPANWKEPSSGSNIAIGIFNNSGSGYSSGSVDDNSACFGSALFPSHEEKIGHSRYTVIDCQLKPTTVSGSVSGSESQVANYPTGSFQSSSIKVYSPTCDQVYMARLYQFTASKDNYSLSDIENARDITGELTGSKNDIKFFEKSFIKLRNDVI